MATEAPNCRADSDAQKLSREPERAVARQAAEERRAAIEKRKQDLHVLAVCLAEAKVTHERLLNDSLDHANFRHANMQDAA
jgi:hypothetical protein